MREGGRAHESVGQSREGRAESETATSPTIFLLPKGLFAASCLSFRCVCPFFLLTPQVRRPPPSAISSAVLKSLVPSLRTSPSHERASLSRPSLAPPFFYCPAVSVLSTPFPVPRQESYTISQIPDESPPESSGRSRGRAGGAAKAVHSRAKRALPYDMSVREGEEGEWELSDVARASARRDSRERSGLLPSSRA